MKDKTAELRARCIGLETQQYVFIGLEQAHTKPRT